MRVAARKTILGLALAVSLGLAVTPAQAAPSGGCVVAATTTCTFSYTGAPETWVVPAGVTSAVFDVWGGQAGGVAADAQHLLPGGSGGKGAHVQATVGLTPGATLNLRVGGAGQDGGEFSTNPGGTANVSGGFNGGGTNSQTCSDLVQPCTIFLGGAGGGSSDVRTSTDGLADRILSAGGGGGAGFGSPGPVPAAPGDPGNGGDSATTAKSVTNGSFTCTGGGAGTLAAPGAAGIGGSSGLPGAAGGLSGGGNGGIPVLGAGGGGYFGGGAGAGASTIPGPIGSGGGGGSDYPNPLSPPAGTSNVTVVNGVRTGDGIITVTYLTPTAVTFASASATRTSKGVLVRWHTGTEADLLGFQVYRSSDHSWRRITRFLIAAKGWVSGASYRYVDQTARHGVAYRYRIEAIDRDGTASWFGPVRVT